MLWNANQRRRRRACLTHDELTATDYYCYRVPRSHHRSGGTYYHHPRPSIMTCDDSPACCTTCIPLRTNLQRTIDAARACMCGRAPPTCNVSLCCCLRPPPPRTPPPRPTYGAAGLPRTTTMHVARPTNKTKVSANYTRRAGAAADAALASNTAVVHWPPILTITYRRR